MFKNIFNVFSKRNTFNSEPKVKPLTQEFKNRILMLYRDVIGHEYSDFLLHLHKRLTYLHGKHILSKTNHNNFNEIEDLLNFISQCSDAHFLDVIEYSFIINNNRYLFRHEEVLNTQINEFFKIDELPYFLTNSTWEECESDFPMSGKAIEVKEFPKIIRKDCEVLHETAILPTLTLLQKKKFHYANEEFLLALEDYKKNDYKDCVVKCCSSLESVMKIICNEKKINYNEKDSASRLIDTLFKNTQLDGFWKQPITLIATIRNKLGSSHGSGTKEKIISEQVAKYTINSTASTIILLCDEFSV